MSSLKLKDLLNQPGDEELVKKMLAEGFHMECLGADVLPGLLPDLDQWRQLTKFERSRLQTMIMKVSGPETAAVQPSAAPSGVVDYLKEIHKLGSTSQVAHNGAKLINFNQRVDGRPVYNLRPHSARNTVPIQLAVPEFQGIISAAWPGEPSGGSRSNSASSGSDEGRNMGFDIDETDMRFARDLAMTMSRSFANEDARVQKFAHMLKCYFTDVCIIVAKRGDRLTDIRVKVKEEQQYVLVKVEAKNEAGRSGDPGIQGVIYYADLLQHISHLLEYSFCPLLCLELVGPQLRISGMAFVGGIMHEELTPMLSLKDMSDRQPEQVATLARCLAAVRKTLPCLKNHYEAAVSAAAAAPSVPQRSGMPLWGNCSEPMPAALHTQLANGEAATARLLAGRNTMVYAVDGGTSARGGARVVKFARGYGGAVHRAWAARGLAPELLEVRPMVGLWVMVTMQFLSPDEGWVPLSALLPRNRTALRKQQEAATAGGQDQGSSSQQQAAKINTVIASLSDNQVDAVGQLVRQKLAEAHEIPIFGADQGSNDEGQQGRLGVHGDMRPPNVLIQLPLESSSSGINSSPCANWDVSQTRVAFIDFDWAGPEGEAKVPHHLNPIVPWPIGMKPGNLISRSLDNLLLEACLREEQGDRARPWEVDTSMGLGAQLRLLFLRDDGSQ